MAMVLVVTKSVEVHHARDGDYRTGATPVLDWWRNDPQAWGNEVSVLTAGFAASKGRRDSHC